MPHHHSSLAVRLAAPLAFAVLGLSLLGAPARAQNIPVHVEELDNGVTALIVPRTNEPGRIAAGWTLDFGASDVPERLAGAHKLIEAMLQRGVSTIGTRDVMSEETLMAEQDTVAKRINEIIENEQFPRFEAGEIDDPIDPQFDTEQLAAFRAELGQLVERQFRIAQPNAFRELYQEAGLENLVISAGQDFTFCGAVVPAGALEFWGWMESERLRSPVFRGFYVERSQRWEQRRRSLEETPLARHAEAFNERFWQGTRYARPLAGDPTDIAMLLRPEVRALFERHMRPEQMIVAVVGDVTVEEAMPVIRRYFGRLEATVQAPPETPSVEAETAAERPAGPTILDYEHPGPNVVEARYRTVPFGHRDEAGLQVVAALINEVWLPEALVEGDDPVAVGGASAHIARSHAGHLTITVEAAPGVEMDALWERTLAFLESLPEREVAQDAVDRTVRNVIATGYRRLQSNDALLNQLLAFAATGDWRLINSLPDQLRAVSPADIERLVEAHLSTDRLWAARYEGTGPAAPRSVEDLDPQFRAQVEPILAQVRQETNINRLRGMVQQFRGIMEQAPENVRGSLEFLLNEIEERIAELEGQGAGEAPTP